MQENHIFDNHFWQHNMRILFQAAFVLYDKSNYTEEILPMLEYYYELWTARAPASGFNRDGVWHNGAGYFNANVKTLYYIPSLFSSITQKDFLQHPWYQNAGKAMAYTWPPASKSAGFGDGSEKEMSPIGNVSPLRISSHGKPEIHTLDGMPPNQQAFYGKITNYGSIAWYATKRMLLTSHPTARN